jgi:hypothetical protein
VTAAVFSPTLCFALEVLNFPWGIPQTINSLSNGKKAITEPCGAPEKSSGNFFFEG